MRALALFLALLMPAPGLAAVYSVASRVSVTGDEVSLADLVPGAPAEWAGVALGRAPRPGGERNLNREWVLQRAQQVGAEVLLDVPADVVLTRPGRQLSGDEVVAAVAQA
ncbi:MAG: hypothetical protein IH608_08120, partial [Proteobacteria bacterium]|nr:hypothetical protein [Pseudomonadota bacterium]